MKQFYALLISTMLLFSLSANAENRIDSVVTSDDSANLILEMIGAFDSGNHYLYYINTDNNSDTGFYSSDYLAVDTALYQYSGTGRNWSWNKISNAVNIYSTSNKAQTRIPLDVLNPGSTIKLKAAIRSADWSQKTFYLPMLEYAFTTKNFINSIHAFDDISNLTLKMKGTFEDGSHYAYFIDTDNNTDTGYYGADRLVVDNVLFEYSGNGRIWQWDIISTDLVVESTSVQSKVYVPLALLNAGDVISFRASVRTADWKQKKIYPQAVEYRIVANDTNSEAKIFIIGDSTVHNNDFPDEMGGFFELGWGDQIGQFMKNPGNVFNEARSGASSKSYKVVKKYNHDWDETKALIAGTDLSKGAYLLIQFGHNDRKIDQPNLGTLPGRGNSFYQELKQYIDEARTMGVTPVLVTSVQTQFKNRFLIPEYRVTILALAEDENVLVLDLAQRSFVEFNTYENSAAIQSIFGYDDTTHFNPTGAKIVASWVKDLACNSVDQKLCNQFKVAP